MNKIVDELKSGKVLISDGAWGTILQEKGLKPGECPEYWNISRRNEVLDIANSYIRAGSQLIETNSFGGNRFKLAHFGLSDQVYELNKAAAEISREAAGPENFVLGSIGPTGKFLIMEEVSEDELYEAFKEQAMALEDGGADAIVIETMTDLEEARIAVKAAKENTNCEIICTMTFDKTVNGEFRTIMGVSPSEMIATLEQAGASIVGANCGNGITDMIEIVKEIRRNNSGMPILIHANAGAPHFCDGQTTFPETPSVMASKISDIIAAGANIIGGCCGTTPDHICEIKAVANSI